MSNPYAGAQTNLEELLAYNPDVIFTISPGFLGRTISSGAWQQLPAVHAHRVFLIPHTPFNWLARPPSFMQILGVQWTASILYPQHYNLDMVQETRDFYRLFLRVELTDQEAREILSGR
jgi:iron complex transport system substrate-binding protein